MIWVFEKLSKAERHELQRLNPLMDYQYSIIKRESSIQTYHLVPGDRRYAKFYPIDSVRQGFICDDVIEAQMLSAFILREIGLDRFSDIAEQYAGIVDYLNVEADPISVRLIALPVRAYIDHYRSVMPECLKALNIDDLRKWRLSDLLTEEEHGSD